MLTSNAVEVVVGHPVAVGRASEDQTTATGAAVDGSLEPVVMQSPPLAGNPVSNPDRLHLLVEGLGYQGIVDPLVVDALVTDDADVVGIAQDPVDLRGRQRLALVLPGRSSAQALRFQYLAEAGVAELASCVELEGQLDQRCSLAIDNDDADVAAIRRNLAPVQVAELGPGRRAAGLDLLLHALLDLSSQVAAVELRDRGHDPVQQCP